MKMWHYQGLLLRSPRHISKSSISVDSCGLYDQKALIRYSALSWDLSQRSQKRDRNAIPRLHQDISYYLFYLGMFGNLGNPYPPRTPGGSTSKSWWGYPLGLDSDSHDGVTQTRSEP